MNTMSIRSWQLNGYYPHVPAFSGVTESGNAPVGMFQPMEAPVPGSVYAALRQAGLLCDPHFELNSLQWEWVKDRWWLYWADVELPAALAGRNLRLRFGGIDLNATITFNNQPLGRSENMYVPFVADVTATAHLGESNRIAVLLENTPDEMGQIGYTSRTRWQKARFVYKWDFCTRMVQLGLHEPVTLEDFGRFALDGARLVPTLEDGRGRLRCEMEITAFSAGAMTAEFTLLREGAEVAQATQHQTMGQGRGAVRAELLVETPQLWYPNGSGSQPLYELHVRLRDESGLSDEKSYSVGFRSVRYLRCEGAGEDTLPYSVEINGRRVYIKGVNLTPLDMMYGDVTAQRYVQTVEALRRANVNLVRVWGGGLIERELFYDLCDRNGVMVWQEFIQSSSGLDNIPSEHPDFLAALRDTATEALKTRRNHVSLTFWSGGNELMEADSTPVTYGNRNIAMLRALALEHNPEALMLPTSASGPREFADPDRPGGNHDVHGPWKYQGPQGHYAFYNRSDSQLHSEFGVDGMSTMESLCAILSPEHRRVASMADDIVWRHHGEWWDTLERDQAIFGEFPADDLEGFVMCSQFIQAEGLRYAVEANRRRAFANAGSIVWQFNEPWPNVSCTCVVDYALRPKLVYYALADAYRPVNPNLQYDSLTWSRGEAFTAKVFLTSDEPAFDARICASVRAQDGGVLLEREFAGRSADNGSACLGELRFPVQTLGSFTVTLTTEHKGRMIASSYTLLVKDERGLCEKEAVWQAWRSRICQD